MNCSKYTQWLSAALDGQLTAQQRRELDAHLAICPDCAALFETLRANAQAMRELDCQFPENLHQRIMGSLPAQAAPVKKNNVVHWRRWGSLAACLVLVAVAALTVTPDLRGKSAPESYAPAAQEPAEIPGTAHGYSTAEQESKTAEYPDTNTSHNGAPDPEAPNSTPEAPPAASAPGNPIVEPVDPDIDIEIGIGEHIPQVSPTPGDTVPGTPVDTASYIRVAYGKTPAPSAVVISSARSLEDYLTGFGTNSFDGEGNPVYNEALLALPSRYDDSYFTGRSLIAVVLEAGSGSIRHEALSFNGSTVTIRVIQPEIGTADMAAWLILIETDEPMDDGAELRINTVF